MILAGKPLEQLHVLYLSGAHKQYRPLWQGPACSACLEPKLHNKKLSTGKKFFLYLSIKQSLSVWSTQRRDISDVTAIHSIGPSQTDYKTFCSTWCKETCCEPWVKLLWCIIRPHSTWVVSQWKTKQALPGPILFQVFVRVLKRQAFIISLILSSAG